MSQILIEKQLLFDPVYMVWNGKDIVWNLMCMRNSDKEKPTWRRTIFQS